MQSQEALDSVAKRLDSANSPYPSFVVEPRELFIVSTCKTYWAAGRPWRAIHRLWLLGRDCAFKERPMQHEESSRPERGRTRAHSWVIPQVLDSNGHACWEAYSPGSDPLLMDRLRTLANFIRHSSELQRERRTSRFRGAADLVVVMAAIKTSDDILSAALAGDEGLFQHLSLRLKQSTGSDHDIAGVCAWRLRKLLAAPIIDIHMEASLRLRRLRHAISDLLVQLDGD